MEGFISTAVGILLFCIVGAMFLKGPKGAGALLSFLFKPFTSAGGCAMRLLFFVVVAWVAYSIILPSQCKGTNSFQHDQIYSDEELRAGAIAIFGVSPTESKFASVLQQRYSPGSSMLWRDVLTVELATERVHKSLTPSSNRDRVTEALREAGKFAREKIYSKVERGALAEIGLESLDQPIAFGKKIFETLDHFDQAANETALSQQVQIYLKARHDGVQPADLTTSKPGEVLDLPHGGQITWSDDGWLLFYGDRHPLPIHPRSISQSQVWAVAENLYGLESSAGPLSVSRAQIGKRLQEFLD